MSVKKLPFISKKDIARIVKEIPGRMAEMKKDKEYDIALTPQQENALRYVEGEGDDYSSERRVMNELAAFYHMCDVASARIFHSTIT